MRPGEFSSPSLLFQVFQQLQEQTLRRLYKFVLRRAIGRFLKSDSVLEVCVASVLSTAASATHALLIAATPNAGGQRSEENTSELQSLMRISYAVFCLKKTNKQQK